VGGPARAAEILFAFETVDAMGMLEFASAGDRVHESTESVPLSGSRQKSYSGKNPTCTKVGHGWISCLGDKRGQYL